MAKNKYWIMSNGIIDGNPPSSDGTTYSDSKDWILDHGLYEKNDKISSNRDILDNCYLELIDCVKDQDDYYGPRERKAYEEMKHEKRLHRAGGGNVSTVDTTPTWAQGAPSNTAKMSHGGRVRDEFIPKGNRELDEDITYDWDGNTSHIRR